MPGASVLELRVDKTEAMVVVGIIVWWCDLSFPLALAGFGEVITWLLLGFRVSLCSACLLNMCADSK